MADRKTKINDESTANQASTEWAQTVMNQLVEAQKSWFEIVAQQNKLMLETVSKIGEMQQKAPTDALADWAKQSLEGFIEAQKRWAEISGQQSEQILQNVQTPNQAQPQSSQNHEALTKMQTAWLDFAAQQNSQMITAMKKSLRLDDNSPAGAFADFAQAAVNNYVEVQKRWIDLALQLPFSGNDQKK